MKKTIITLSLLLCVCGLCFAQQSIYVSAKGNDNNDGLSEAKAKKNLFLALAWAIEWDINKITVIGTLTKESENENDNYDFRIFSLGKEILITGKPGATGTERAVLSGNGKINEVLVFATATNDKPIEINGGGNKKAGLFIYKNSTITLGKGAVVQGNDSGIFISDNGTCVISEGAVVQNNSKGVMIDEKATCIINKGEVRNNTGTGISCIGKLNLNDGTISNNKLSGVIILKGGRFTMSGGTINDNSSPKFGGGVNIQSGGRFDQTGGTISGNTEPQIYRDSGSLGSDLSGSSSSSSGSSSSGNSSSSSGSSSTKSSGFDWHIPLFIGLYFQGWHQNTFSIGMPIQLGVEFDFGSAISLALLGEASGGIGYPYLLEGNYGGMAELYFLNKRFGVGAGYGNALGYYNYDFLTTYEDGEEPVNTFSSNYMRFALIFRGDGKTSLYAQRYTNGDWGIGIQIIWDMFD